MQTQNWCMQIQPSARTYPHIPYIPTSSNQLTSDAPHTLNLSKIRAGLIEVGIVAQDGGHWGTGLVPTSDLHKEGAGEGPLAMSWGITSGEGGGGGGGASSSSTISSALPVAVRWRGYRGAGEALQRCLDQRGGASDSPLSYGLSSPLGGCWVIVGATPVPVVRGEAGAAIIGDLKRCEWVARKQVTLKIDGVT